jgi:hypothetical protein
MYLSEVFCERVGLVRAGVAPVPRPSAFSLIEAVLA